MKYFQLISFWFCLNVSDLSTIQSTFIFSIWTLPFIWYLSCSANFLSTFFFNFVLWNYSEIIELRCLPFCMASWTQCLSICSLSWLWSSKTQFFLPAWWQVEWAVARSPQHLKSFASIYNWEGTFALLSNVMSYFKHTFEENILLNVQLNS